MATKEYNTEIVKNHKAMAIAITAKSVLPIRTKNIEKIEKAHTGDYIYFILMMRHWRSMH